MNLSSDTVAVLKNFSDINQNILVKPGNKVQTISTMKNILAEAEISEKFDSEFAIYDLPEFFRAVMTLNLPDVAVKGDGKSIILVATDKKNKSSNDYSMVVGETNKTFTAYFKAENFKMVSDDYDVAISKQKISHFVNRNKPIQYWIALEPDSEF